MSERDLFYKARSPEHARQLFQRHVHSVEIETFSYCNRRCNYCPNAIIDRISDNRFLDTEVFEQIIFDLGKVNYDRIVTLSHYNEPLSNRDILKHIAFARAHLPDAVIQIFTNGDYLDKRYLEDLVEAGLSAIHISIHLADTAAYDELKIFDRISEMSLRIGIAAKHKHFHSGRSIEAVFPHRKIEMRIFEADYANIGGDRGGLMSHITTPKRNSPCSYPFNTLTIAYNGYLIPCCQIRADAREHDGYRLGHVSDFPSIFEAYANSNLVEWRRSLFTYGPKNTPCNSCNQACIPNDPSEIARREEMAVSFGMPIGHL